MMSLEKRINAFTDNLSVEQIKQFCMILEESKHQALEEYKEALVNALTEKQEGYVDLELKAHDRGKKETAKTFSTKFSVLENVICLIESGKLEDTTNK